MDWVLPYKAYTGIFGTVLGSILCCDVIDVIRIGIKIQQGFQQVNACSFLVQKMCKYMFKVNKITLEQYLCNIILLSLNRYLILYCSMLQNVTTHTITILQQMLQNYYCACDHFATSGIKGLNLLSIPENKVRVTGFEITAGHKLWRRDFSGYFQPNRLKIL